MLKTPLLAGAVLACAATSAWAQQNAPCAMHRVARPIAFLVRTLAPVVDFIRLIVRTAFKVIGVETDPDAHMLAPTEQIKGAIDLHHSEGGVDKASILFVPVAAAQISFRLELSISCLFNITLFVTTISALFMRSATSFVAVL